eukprot:1201960-Pyramimonas_sp.AAC.1
MRAQPLGPAAKPPMGLRSAARVGETAANSNAGAFDGAPHGSTNHRGGRGECMRIPSPGPS